jgi:serine/threonine protein kinase
LFGSLKIGECIDFVGYNLSEMKLPWQDGMSPGGASDFLAPEIANTRSRVAQILDYDRADIWSLSIVLGEMMGARPGKPMTLPLYSHILPFVVDLFNGMNMDHPRQRLSCYEVYSRAVEYIKDFLQSSKSFADDPPRRRRRLPDRSLITLIIFNDGHYDKLERNIWI